MTVQVSVLLLVLTVSSRDILLFRSSESPDKQFFISFTNFLFKKSFLQLPMSSGGATACLVFFSVNKWVQALSLKGNCYSFFNFVCLFKSMQNFGFLWFSLIRCWRMATWKPHASSSESFESSLGITRVLWFRNIVFMDKLAALVDKSVSGHKWVVLLEGWDMKRDTREIKSLSLLLNLGTHEMFFSSVFFFFLPLFLFYSFSLLLHFLFLFDIFFWLHVFSIHVIFADVWSSILLKLSTPKLLTWLDGILYLFIYFCVCVSRLPFLLNLQ